MKYFILVNILLLVFSCNMSSWKDEIHLELSKASDIKFNPFYLNKGDVKSPPNTWVSLISYQKDNLYKCLFFKIPYGDKTGVLKLVGNKRRKCTAFDDGTTLNEKIKSLRVNFSFDKSDKNRGHIVLTVSLLAKDEVIMAPLLNFSVKQKYAKYSNQLPLSLVSDVAIGTALQKPSLKDGDLCHGVNRECKDVVAKKCDQCPEGFYEVVDNNCSQGGSKYCGRNRCGEKNQPACPRGYKVLDTKLSALCFEGSPAGFCKPGLYTSCNSDGILVCL